MYNFDKVVYTDDFMWKELGIRKIPNYLYHYTSVDTLLKIIDSNSIKFNRLDLVNDPEEGVSSTLKYANTAVFVSCWSADEKESLQMWSMYGDGFKGVRLKLPINMFTGRNAFQVLEKGGCYTFLDDSLVIERKNFPLPIKSSIIHGPNKVAYVKGDSIRVIKGIYEYDDHIHINLYDLGLFKKIHWEEEREWRFKINVLLHEFNYPKDELTNRILDLERYPIIQKNLFAKLDPAIFNEMEIILGPLANQDSVDKVEKQVSGLGCRLFNSAIKIK